MFTSALVESYNMAFLNEFPNFITDFVLNMNWDPTNLFMNLNKRRLQ